MKQLVRSCCNIYISILQELLGKINCDNNIKTIVKRKAKLRVEDIKRLYRYYNNGQVISYMSEMRNVEEGTYQFLAIQNSNSYEEKFEKVRPGIKDKELLDYVADNKLINDDKYIIHMQFNYYCKYSHAGELYDLLLSLANNNDTNVCLNNIFSSCISILACELVNSFCKLLGLEEIKIANLIAVFHIFYGNMVMAKNMSVFQNYIQNLEYDFKKVNSDTLEYISKIFIDEFLVEPIIKNINSNELNDDLKHEIKEHKLKKIYIDTINNYANDLIEYNSKLEKKSKEQIIEALNKYSNKK